MSQGRAANKLIAQVSCKLFSPAFPASPASHLTTAPSSKEGRRKSIILSRYKISDSTAATFTQLAQQTLFQTRPSAYIKDNAKRSIACWGGKNVDSIPDYLNMSSMRRKIQKGYRWRDTRDSDGGERQHRDTAG